MAGAAVVAKLPCSTRLPAPAAAPAPAAPWLRPCASHASITLGAQRMRSACSRARAAQHQQHRRQVHQRQQQRAVGQLRPGCSRGNRRMLHVVASGAAGGLATSGHGGRGEPLDSLPKKLLAGAAVLYIALVVILPFVNVFIQAFAKGLPPFIEAIMDPDFFHALRMTLSLALVSVPLNTIFGTIAAINITRNEFPGKVFLLSLLDLPFSISPVVTGLMLMLLYGRAGWFAHVLAQHGISVVFAFPGMALATMFVTLPFVVRELIPTLEAMDMAEEEAARTLGANDWQVFWNVTLPNIRWGLMYGVILTNARAMGEFGAVSVISGNIIGRTQTLTLFVESAYKEYNSEAAFAAAVLLSLLALATLFIKDKVEAAAAAEALK